MMYSIKHTRRCQTFLVKLFTPLLPKAVRERIRFESGPLSEVEDLREVAEGGAMRIEFVEEVAALAYGD